MIGIIGFESLRSMQFLKKYTTILDSLNLEYDVIYWERDINPEHQIPPFFNGRAICFKRPILSTNSFALKIIDFWEYRRFILTTVADKKYDKLIVLTTPTAICLYSLLITRYKGKFIFDYRDITKERIGIYKKMVLHLMRASFCVMISSFGFLEKLSIIPTDKYIQANNTQVISQNSLHEPHCSRKYPIKVTYWGYVRQLEYYKKVCDLFGKDERFCLKFHGAGFIDSLKHYCQNKEYNNIEFEGKYQLSDLAQFAKNTDILCCLYDNDETQKYAMPVKIYDAFNYKLPVLITKNSYLERKVGMYPAVYSMNIGQENVLNDLVDWYRSLTTETIDSTCNNALNEIYIDDIKFLNKLKEFIKEEKNGDKDL